VGSFGLEREGEGAMFITLNSVRPHCAQRTFVPAARKALTRLVWVGTRSLPIELLERAGWRK